MFCPPSSVRDGRSIGKWGHDKWLATTEWLWKRPSTKGQGFNEALHYPEQLNTGKIGSLCEDRLLLCSQQTLTRLSNLGMWWWSWAIFQRAGTHEFILDSSLKLRRLCNNAEPKKWPSLGQIWTSIALHSSLDWVINDFEINLNYKAYNVRWGNETCLWGPLPKIVTNFEAMGAFNK